MTKLASRKATECIGISCFKRSKRWYRYVMHDRFDKGWSVRGESSVHNYFV